jgi:hypothetical protein
MLDCLIEFLFGVFLWFKYPGWVCGMNFGLGFCKQFHGEFLLVGFRHVEKCCGKLVLAGFLLGGLAVERYVGGVWGVLGFSRQCVFVLPIHSSARIQSKFGYKYPPIYRNCNFDKFPKVWYTIYTGTGNREGRESRTENSRLTISRKSDIIISQQNTSTTSPMKNSVKSAAASMP